MEHFTTGKNMELNFLRRINAIILILTLPKLSFGECVFGVNNTSQLVLRNQTLLGILNDTLLNSTDAGDAAVSTVSDFGLWTYLKVNNSIRPTSYLDFVSKGRMLAINWTIATRGAKTNETSESRTVASYIITEFVVPLHSKLQALAVQYSFSLGIFRPFITQFQFTGIIMPSLVTVKPTLDLNCIAGSMFLWRVSTDYLYVSAFENKNGTHFANLATAVEQTFDQYYRRHTVLNKDFVRVNIIDAFAGSLNYTVLLMEIYFLNETFDSAYITKQTPLANIPTIYYADTTKSASIAVKVRTNTTFTHIINVTTSSSTSTSTSVATTTTASTIPSTTVSTLTDVATTSAVLSTLPESSTVAATVTTSSTNASTFVVSSTTVATTLSANELTVKPQNTSFLSGSTHQLELSTGVISNETTILVNFTTLPGDFISSALSSSATVELSSSNNNTNVTTSLVAENRNTTVAPSDGSTSLEISTVPRNFADLGSSNKYSTSSVTTQLFQTTFGSMKGNSTYETTVNLNILPNTNSTPNSSALSGGSVPFQTTLKSNVLFNTDTSSSNGTSNGSGYSTSNGTSNGSMNGFGNTYLTHNVNESTFDPDPYFKPTAPVIRKIYNDHILLHQIGPMAPLTEKLAFLSITIPFALGISVAVIACILCLQAEWLSGKSVA